VDVKSRARRDFPREDLFLAFVGKVRERRSFWSLSPAPRRRLHSAIMPRPRKDKYGMSFVEWCNESGRRGARLLLECREKDPSKFTKGSSYKALWKCAEEKCRHKWRATVNSRTTRVRFTGCPKCENQMQHSKTKNFLAWCNANGELGKRLLEEFCDTEKKPEELTKASHYKATWKCSTCAHKWSAQVSSRTKSVNPSGCHKCANQMPLSKTYNFLVWCNANGELGKRLLEEFCDTEKKPEELTKGSNYKAKWKCLNKMCRHEWSMCMYIRTRSVKPGGCPMCHGGVSERNPKRERAA